MTLRKSGTILHLKKCKPFDLLFVVGFCGQLNAIWMFILEIIRIYPIDFTMRKWSETIWEQLFYLMIWCRITEHFNVIEMN